MKVIAAVVGTAFLIIAGVLVSLVRSGGALKPAGVIKPAEIGADPAAIGKQIAVRLFPDFREAQDVVWRLDGGAEDLAEIARSAFTNYRGLNKPTLHDLRNGSMDSCVENCWYILDLESPLPEALARKTKTEPTAEVFIQYFDRSEQVPEACDNEKILTLKCMRPVSVREVRRKIKTSAPYFFMQRYQKAQFYLFIEKQK